MSMITGTMYSAKEIMDHFKTRNYALNKYTVIRNYGNSWFLLYSFLINRHKVIKFSTYQHILAQQ